jgi:hypothetical protein
VANGHLEDSLRREIESYLESRLSAVKQEITTLQSLLNESLTTFLDRQADVQMEGSLVAAITEHLHAAHERGVELAASESSRAKASSDMAIVKAAIGEINEQKSQADILKALVNRASSFAPRVAFFVIKGEQATGWRGRGFEGTVGDDAIQKISLPLSADTVVGSAARGRATWSGGPGSHCEDHLLLNRFGEEAPQRIVAIPLNVRGKAVAVLYADSAGLDSESINLEALETLVTVSGMAVEMLSAARTPKRAAEESVAPPAHYPAEERPSSSYQPESEYVAAPVAEAEPSYSAAETLQSYEPAPVEPEAMVEAIPVDEPAGMFEDAAPQANDFVHTGSEYSEPESVPYYSSQEQEHHLQEPQLQQEQPQQRKRYGQDAELPVEVSDDEERRLHNNARRFARLLISEIKLYNEQKVAEGRSEHDLYDRLREYIDRSREMYDKRVKPEVANRYDYFHGELVNMLAEGDPSKLGSNYPGATVNV